MDNSMENSMVVLQKIKSGITIYPENARLGINTKELKAGS